MDSFELNKILGALLGTVFILFSVNLASNTIFASPAPEKPGYAIVAAEPAEGGGGAAEAPAGVESVLPLLASADVAAGQAVFKKCQTCHDGTKGGPNKTGPNLWSVVDRPIAAHEGFSYSAGMKEFSKGSTEKWTFEHLDGFLHAPKEYVKGTAMGFAGIKKTDERANLIAYLHTLSDSPVALPPAGAADKAAAGDAAAPAAGGDAAAPAAEAPAAGDAAAPAAEAPAAGDAAAPATPAPADNGNSAAPAPAAPAAGDAAAPAKTAPAASGDAPATEPAKPAAPATPAPKNGDAAAPANPTPADNGNSAAPAPAAPAAGDASAPASTAPATSGDAAAPATEPAKPAAPANGAATKPATPPPAAATPEPPPAPKN